MLVLFQLKNGKEFTANVDKNIWLTKNFQLYELANNKGNPKQPQFIFNADVDVWLSILQEYRLWYSKPIDPTSGYRQAAWNKKVGGAKDSLHLKNLAVDYMDTQTLAQFKTCAIKFKNLCEKRGIIGEANYYGNRVHLGAFANKNGYRSFQCRDYTRPKGGKEFSLIDLTQA